MKSEKEIREQIEFFEMTRRNISEVVPQSKHKLYELQAIDREITALRWVIDELE